MAALATILSLLALWLIARNAANLLDDRGAPAEAVRFWPSSGAADASLALDRVVAANGAVDGQSHALLEAALRRAPLLGDPLILAGLEASAAGDNARARRLMEEARRRDPRAVIARSWLFDDYLGSGDYAAGLAEAGPLMVLQRAAGPAILTVLTSLLAIPQARPALVAELRTNPWWRVGFFRQTSDSPTLVPAMASLLRDAPNPYPPAAMRERQALVEGLAAEGRHALAHDMWLTQLPPAYRQTARTRVVYDGEFRGWPGTPPFGWRLISPGDGTVTRTDVRDLPERSALEISSDAYKKQTAAEQLLMAPPGAYRLAFKLRRAADSDAGNAQLGVTISCTGSRAMPASGTFTPAAAAAEAALNVVIPGSCPAQWLRLLIVPGDDPGPLDVQVTAVRMLPRRGAAGG